MGKKSRLATVKYKSILWKYGFQDVNLWSLLNTSMCLKKEGSRLLQVCSNRGVILILTLIHLQESQNHTSKLYLIFFSYGSEHSNNIYFPWSSSLDSTARKTFSADSFNSSVKIHIKCLQILTSPRIQIVLSYKVIPTKIQP